MTNQQLISVGSLVVYCFVLTLLALGGTIPAYKRWGWPLPYRKPFKWFLGKKTDDKRCLDGKHDDRWKLDWGSCIFIWAVLLRNIYVLKLIYVANTSHIDILLAGLYLIDAMTGIIFYYYVRQEGRRRKALMK